MLQKYYKIRTKQDSFNSSINQVENPHFKIGRWYKRISSLKWSVWSNQHQLWWSLCKIKKTNVLGHTLAHFLNCA